MRFSIRSFVAGAVSGLSPVHTMWQYIKIICRLSASKTENIANLAVRLTIPTIRVRNLQASHRLTTTFKQMVLTRPSPAGYTRAAAELADRLPPSVRRAISFFLTFPVQPLLPSH